MAVWQDLIKTQHKEARFHERSGFLFFYPFQLTGYPLESRHTLFTGNHHLDDPANVQTKI
jgi:hypothetical protein